MSSSWWTKPCASWSGNSPILYPDEYLRSM
jgi:hypothetical protein